MCGLAGVFRWRGRITRDDVLGVLAMLDAQIHRGPDDWGVLLPASLAAAGALPRGAGDGGHVVQYRDGEGSASVVLGARRLSILDRSERGRMPMGDEGGRRFVAHNGEISNHRALRAELEAHGARFRSSGDTEVILRGHARWGDAVVPRLGGMFAFALVETGPPPRLLLARDRIGIKPLYYHEDGARLVWASEVRALRASGLIPDAANPRALVRFLQLGSVAGPDTTAAGVSSLEPGHVLVAEAAGAPAAVRRYWALGAATPASSEAGRGGRRRAAEQTRELLEESVARHLDADVPLGVFLSGGIDSSALVALAAPLTRRPLTTLTLSYDEAGAGEAALARTLAARYGTDHHEIRIESAECFDALPAFFSAMDQPSVDGLNAYLIARAARRLGITAVLSGTGGDEVFWGYGHLRRGGLLERAGRVVAALPRPTRAVLARAARLGAGVLGRGALDRVGYLEPAADSGLYVLVRGLYGPEQVAQLLGVGRGEVEAYGPPLAEAHGGGANPTGEALARAELSHYLPNQLLRDADVMGMAHSVEVRVPFLDHRLIEHVAGLPSGVKRGRRPKPLLLDALGDRLPRPAWDRPKTGFTLPLGRWMAARADELRAETLAGALLEPRAVARVWDGFAAGRVHWSRPWALLVVERAFGRARRAAA